MKIPFPKVKTENIIFAVFFTTEIYSQQKKIQKLFYLPFFL